MSTLFLDKSTKTILCIIKIKNFNNQEEVEQFLILDSVRE